MRQENENNKQQITNLNKKIQEIENQKTSTETELNESVIKQQELTQEIESLKTELEEARAEKESTAQDLTVQLEELKTSSQATHSEHLTKNQELEKQVQAFKTQINRLETDKGEINASKETVFFFYEIHYLMFLKKHEQELETLRAENDELRGQISTLEEQLETLRSESQEKEEASNKEIEQLKTQIQELEGEKHETISSKESVKKFFLPNNNNPFQRLCYN